MKNEMILQKILKAVCKDYNAFLESIDLPTITIDDLTVAYKQLNHEFDKRAIHLDNGNYTLRSGIENVYYIDTTYNDSYVVKDIWYDDISGKQHKMELHYIG